MVTFITNKKHFWKLSNIQLTAKQFIYEHC